MIDHDCCRRLLAESEAHVRRAHIAFGGGRGVHRVPRADRVPRVDGGELPSGEIPDRGCPATEVTSAHTELSARDEERRAARQILPRGRGGRARWT